MKSWTRRSGSLHCAPYALPDDLDHPLGHPVDREPVEDRTAAGPAESSQAIRILKQSGERPRQVLRVIPRVPVLAGDTAETLAARVLVQEHRLYPAVLARFAAGDRTHRL